MRNYIQNDCFHNIGYFPLEILPPKFAIKDVLLLHIMLKIMMMTIEFAYIFYEIKNKIQLKITITND